MPALAAAAVRVGFCKVEENPFGPLQDQAVAPVAEPERLNVVPAHTGSGEAVADTSVGTDVVTTTLDVLATVPLPQTLLAVSV